MKWLRKLLGGEPDWRLPPDPGIPQGMTPEAPCTQATFNQVLKDLKVPGHVIRVMPGPAVTVYACQLEPSARNRSFANSAVDIRIHLGVGSVRYLGTYGNGLVGFEVANVNRHAVPLEVFLTDSLYERRQRLPIVLSQPNGRPHVFDLTAAPHLIIAGATGSGKSVLLNTILSSWMYTMAPSELRMTLIDPKRTEFMKFRGLPHLHELVTTPPDAARSLQELCEEMEGRYSAIASKNCSNWLEWNERLGDPWHRLRMIPWVCVVDEFADLFLSDQKGVGEPVLKLAQKARAAGIHLVIATQRPSREVFPGLIKANFPVRIALRVSSKVNSQVIIDQPGAENLLGMGDCLLQDGAETIRLHGPWISNEHVERVVKHWARQ